MASTSEQPLTDQPVETEPANGEAPILQPVISAKWAWSAGGMFICITFALLIFAFSMLPLRGTDIWGHVMYGQHILASGIPTQDPLLPFSNGMEIVDSAWLSQVIFALVERGGGEMLSALFTFLMVTSFAVLAFTFYRQTGRATLVIGGVLLILIVGWSRMATIRPENFGFLIFSLLAVQLFANRGLPSRQTTHPIGQWIPWIGIPVLMGLWANLHGSFICGILLLGCFAVGTLIDRWIAERSFVAAISSDETQKYFWFLLLGFAATLVNPYGLDLWISTLNFVVKPQLVNLVEWQSLSLLDVGGVEFMISIGLLMVVLRLSKLPLTAVDVLLLLVFAAVTIKSIRMIGWYAPVFALVVIPHLAYLLEQVWPKRELGTEYVLEETGESSLPPGRSWRYAWIGVLCVWCGFALAPASVIVLGGNPRTPQQLYGESPVTLTEYLQEKPINGIVHVPQWWGDWLQYAGPKETLPMVNTNVHVLPPQVWSDYERILNSQPGWERVCRRYAIETIILDRQRQQALQTVLETEPDWIETKDSRQANDPNWAIFEKVKQS